MKEPQQYEREKLEGMTIPELVGVILRQQEWAQQMYEEVEKLKAINNRNSKDSSKPPSSDFLKLSEKAKEVPEEEEEGKKKVGGQEGHKGKTRKGFKRVDRYEILSPEACPKCGSQAWTEIGTSVRQTARLVAKPLYNRRISATAMSMSELCNGSMGRTASRSNRRARHRGKITRDDGVAGELWTYVLRKTARMATGNGMRKNRIRDNRGHQRESSGKY